tara:strand:+ start:478 stop:663 length:186 start_codon:yes stop_codon:yes gene_type:complete
MKKMAMMLRTVKMELNTPLNKLYLNHPDTPVVFGGGGKSGFGVNFDRLPVSGARSVILYRS